MSTKKSIGEQRVRVDFNTLGDTTVDQIKRSTAALINLVEPLKELDARSAALAQTYYEQAGMWAVKAATAKAPAVPDDGLQPHQRRMLEERDQLAERIDRLKQFLRDPNSYHDPSMHELGRLRKQHNLMEQYLHVLNERIAAFQGE